MEAGRFDDDETAGLIVKMLNETNSLGAIELSPRSGERSYVVGTRSGGKVITVCFTSALPLLEAGETLIYFLPKNNQSVVSSWIRSFQTVTCST